MAGQVKFDGDFINWRMDEHKGRMELLARLESIKAGALAHIEDCTDPKCEVTARNVLEKVKKLEKELRWD